MYPRFLSERILSTNMPVILINGARQVGKSTLVKTLFGDTHDYVTLDDPQTLSLVKRNPLNFVQNQLRPLIIDEIQRYPDVLLAIKMIVDEKRQPRHFVLTGSVNVLGLKDLKDSLAGRMVVYNLWTLSQEEIQGKQSSFLESLFLEKLQIPSFDFSVDIFNRIQRGGYPLVLLEKDPDSRREWIYAYITQLINKDIRDLSNIEGLTEIPNILGLLASRTGSLLNVNDLSRSLHIPHTTLNRYLSLLQSSFLFCPLNPWEKNFGKRLTKSSKSFLNDTAIVECLLNKDARTDSVFFGHILENFVMLELVKQLSYKMRFVKLYHFRSVKGEEVDFVLEAMNGDVVAIEVKSSSQFSLKDTKGLQLLKQSLGEKFKQGILLYRGQNMLPIESKICAVPVEALWS
jgi:predicted AAA+ superfamily ATPase